MKVGDKVRCVVPHSLDAGRSVEAGVVYIVAGFHLDRVHIRLEGQPDDLFWRPSRFVTLDSAPTAYGLPTWLPPPASKVSKPRCTCDLRSVIMVTGCRCGGA